MEPKECPLTQGQWSRMGELEHAQNVGEKFPDRAWILTPLDTWVKNPFYKGEPVPHPEDYNAQT